MLNSLEKQNLTSRSFFIEKAQFRIKSGDSENSGIATIKFLKPDRFLISVKSVAGIEIARICLTGDSILANDRFNKKFYYGSTSFLKNKYGLTTSILPVVFGDYVNDSKADITATGCIDGKMQIQGFVKDVKINYLIDCNNGKSLLTVPDDSFKESNLQIEYSDFFRIDNIYTPGRIEISDIQHNTVIEIKIQRIIIPWEGSIEFIPGKQYEKINLL
ncbi:MAG: DUF4292 domain-containing protein [Bacteroidales bacterium]|nr:DUF4292 domain-containing protein [Bacteroidales bacterium]